MGEAEQRLPQSQKFDATEEGQMFVSAALQMTVSLYRQAWNAVEKLLGNRHISRD